MILVFSINTGYSSNKKNPHLNSMQLGECPFLIQAKEGKLELDYRKHCSQKLCVHKRK